VLVQVHTDPNIQSSVELTARVEALVSGAVGHVADRVSRVQVHLGDENSSSKRGSNDMRCMMEARLDGRPPIAVTHQAGTLDEAIDGAAAKLERSINSMVDRLRGY
jgi:ribosome-associated translation inhibitor RaiA